MFTCGTPVAVIVTMTDIDCSIGYVKAVAGLEWAKLGTSKGASYSLETILGIQA